MIKGKVHNKDSFLNNIAKNLGRQRRTTGVTKPKWKHTPQWDVFKDYSQDDLVSQLKSHCERIHTQFETATVATLQEKLSKVIEEFHGKSIITWDDPRFKEYNLEKYFNCELTEQGKSVQVWNTNIGEKNVAIAEKADVGITFSDMTLAESATVVLLSDKGKGRSVSLLPTTYIAIVPKSTVVPRMTQATHHVHKMVEETGEVPACVNFISGPSNSADIEMNLVVGVHGPIRACYILVEDK